MTMKNALFSLPTLSAATAGPDRGVVLIVLGSLVVLYALVLGGLVTFFHKKVRKYVVIGMGAATAVFLAAMLVFGLRGTAYDVAGFCVCTVGFMMLFTLTVSEVPVPKKK